MASRCCGNRLSLPNQYDTQTPARVSRCGRQDRLYIRAVRCPSRSFLRDSLASRIRCTALVSKWSFEKFHNFGKEIFRQKSSELPGRRTCLANLG
jgi:hypothetical protein